MEYNTVNLEKWRVNLRRTVSKHLIDARVEVRDDFVGGIEANIKGFIWAEPLQHVEIKYPATWQDAWKEEYLKGFVAFRGSYRVPTWLARLGWRIARWALRRWPIQYKTHIVDVKAVFPELRLGIPEEPYVIHYTEEHG